MIFNSRHYVTMRDGWFRKFVVTKTIAIPSGRPSGRGRQVTFRYEPVSRHFTWRGATRRCHRLNAQEGRTA